MKKGQLHYSKQFENKGYALVAFSNSDTDRIDQEVVYKYYAAKDGRMIKKFQTLKDAALWIEFK